MPSSPPRTRPSRLVRRVSGAACLAVVAAMAGAVLTAGPADAQTRSVRDGRDAVVPRLDLRQVTFSNTRERLRATVQVRGLRARGALQLTLRFDDTRGYAHSAVVTRYPSGATGTSWTWQPSFGGSMETCPKPMSVRVLPKRDRVVMIMPRCKRPAARYLVLESSRPDADSADRIDLDGRIGAT
ncbi:hypothetical protein KLP28_04840 [Nocardioidaceae bacterium]|nr:hypothetical protein KLP28_04840 [Nocardioidaceae bacterium]